MLRTAATRDGDDYLINGRKWLITGAEGADFGASSWRAWRMVRRPCS